jgi:hypothetical protein
MHPSHPAPPEKRFREKAVTVFKSPMLLAMLIAGVALVIGVPYLALQTLPGIANPVTGEVASKGNPNLGIDFQELNGLPGDLGPGAATILGQEQGVMPQSLTDLPEANGFGLVYPVTEAVESIQPTFTWTAFARAPYKIVIKDEAKKIVATAQSIPVPSFLIPVKLERDKTYSWEVTAGDGEVQGASFVILSDQDTDDWQMVRKQFKDSPLALGLAAEHLGMLSTAEREYKELARQYPNAEAPARLLANVLSLRE